MDGREAISHTAAPQGKSVHPKAELAQLLAQLPPDATASDVAVLAILWTHSGSDGLAWPGQARIAARARTSERTVRSVAKRLEAAGIIERRVPDLRTRPQRKTTRYRLPGAVAGPRRVRPLPIEAPQRQPLPVEQRQPLPPKESKEITKSQRAREDRPAPAAAAAPAPIAVALVAALAARPRLAAAPVVAALDARAPAPARTPDTAPALAALRAWRAAQLPLPLSPPPGGGS